MRRASQYLEGRLRSLTNPYAVAMVSYALANEGRLSQEVLFRHGSSGTLNCVCSVFVLTVSVEVTFGL